MLRRLLLTAIAIAGALPMAARAQMRVAFSQALSVEVFSDQASWCGETPTFRVVVQDAETFANPAFQTLVQRFGSVLISRDCPAARSVNLRGTLRGTQAVTWTGTMSAADGWKLPKQTAARDPVVAPSPAAPTPVPARRPGEGTPLFGEWRGTAGCGADMVPMTMSVSEIQGVRFRAVVEMGGRGTLRYWVEGTFDDLSGQFAWKQSELIRSNGGSWPQMQGTLAPTKTTISLQIPNCFFSTGSGSLSKVSGAPVVAERVEADTAKRAKLIEEASARPHPDRLVGAVPPGIFREPICEELYGWVQSAPTDLRVKIVPGGYNTAGILRQYDDAHSAAVFGTPLYYMAGADQNFRLGALVEKVCPGRAHNRDPLFDPLRQLVNDGDLSDLRIRHDTDRAAERLPILLATAGGPPDEKYADLSQLTDPAKVAEQFQAFTGVSSLALTEENRRLLVEDAVRLQKDILADLITETRDKLSALPMTEQGLVRAQEIVAGATKILAPDAAATVIQDGDARRKVIAAAVLERETAALADYPKTLNGIADATRRAVALKAAISPELPDAAGAIDKALGRYADAAWPMAIAEEQRALDAIPASQEGLKSLIERRAAVTRQAGANPPAVLADYLKATDAKIGQIGAASKRELKADLDGLPVSWQSVATVRTHVAEAASPYGDSQVAKEMRAMGDERVQKILAALADAVIASLKDYKASAEISGPSAGIISAGDLFFRQSGQAAAPFRADADGAAQADRILAAFSKEAEVRANDGFSDYKASVKRAAPSRQMALKLARASLLLAKMARDLPAAGQYRDLTRDAAVDMKATACDAVAAEAKLSGSDAKRPILVHNQIVPLSQFVCDLKDAGILVGGFEKPGYFSSSSDYTLKLYVPEEFAGKMSPEMVGALGSVLLGDAYRRHRPEPDDGNPFDFSAVEASDSAAAVNSTVQKIVLREVEAFVGKIALVGVQIGDEAKLEAVSVAQWRQASAVLASLASVSEPSPNVCAAFKENASNLDLETAGQAMLFCGKT